MKGLLKRGHPITQCIIPKTHIKTANAREFFQSSKTKQRAIHTAEIASGISLPTVHEIGP